MGRKKLDFVWEHFITSNVKGKIEYFCKYCNEKYREKNVSKKRRHILKCQLCPKNVKADVTRNYNALEVTTYKTKKQKAAEAQGKKMTASPKKITILKTQPSYMEGFTLNQTTSVNCELAHERLCRAIIVTGCKVSMIDDPLWRNVWQTLEPSYFPPTKDVFLNIYSENEYSKVCTDLTTMLTEAEFLHLQCERLACLQMGTIAIWAVTDKPLFIKFIHLKNEDEAQILYEELQNILSNYLSEKFLSIIGSENSDVLMALEALKSRNDHLVTLVCPLNILEQLCDLIIKFESVVTFFQKAIMIISSIYKNDLLSAVFSQIQGNKRIILKAPITKNYESHLQCLEDLLKCKNYLQQFAISNQLASFFRDAENKQLKKDILDEDFWSYVEQLIAIVSPLVGFLKELKTNPQIHKIKDQWFELEKKLILTIHASFLKDEEKTEINSLFSEKKAKVLSPIHLAACLLDPGCQGANLTDEESLDATEFIHTVAGNTQGIDSQAVMEDLGNFRCKIKIWSRSFIWKSAEKMTPLTWWRGICSHSPLSKVAARILTVPAVSVSSTKSESALKWMETGRKQGLNMEKIEKFVSVSHNYKILNENNFEVKDEPGRDGNTSIESVIVQGAEHVQSEGVEENDAVEYLEYEYIEDNS